MIYDTLKQLAERASPAYARLLARGRIKGDDTALNVYGKFATPDTVLALLKDLAAAQKQCEQEAIHASMLFDENNDLKAKLAAAQTRNKEHEQLATIENETIERCVQLCLLERDRADKREPDPPGSTMNLDHIMGQGWMANLLAKKLRALKKEG